MPVFAAQRTTPQRVRVILRNNRISMELLASWLDRSVASLYRDINAYCNDVRKDSKLTQFLDELVAANNSDEPLDIKEVVTCIFGEEAANSLDSVAIVQPAVASNIWNNLHANYINTLPLTPEDKLMNGRNVEDHSQEMPAYKQRELSDALRVFGDLVGSVKGSAIRMTDSRYVWFSDSQHSFIQHFPTPETLETTYHDYEMLRKYLVFLKDILSTSRFIDCGLDQVSGLKDEVSLAINSIDYLFSSCESACDRFGGHASDEECDAVFDKAIDDAIEELNRRRRVDLSSNYTWYVCVAVIELSEHYSVSTRVMRGNYTQVRDKFRRLLEREQEIVKVVRCEAFGTYRDRASATDVESYIKVDFSGTDIDEFENEDDVAKIADAWFDHLMDNKIVNRRDGRMRSISPYILSVDEN